MKDCFCLSKKSEVDIQLECGYFIYIHCDEISISEDNGVFFYLGGELILFLAPGEISYLAIPVFEIDCGGYNSHVAQFSFDCHGHYIRNNIEIKSVMFNSDEERGVYCEIC